MKTRPSHVWWSHVGPSLLVFAPLAAVLATTNADMSIAGALFFDSTSGRWAGAQSEWINPILHTGGRWAIRALITAALLAWMYQHFSPRRHASRRSRAYFIVSMVLGIGTVGLLKTLTNVDCPWDLQAFGGSFPFVHLFEDRPDALRHAACFPAAHASSGYALVTLYFVWRERSATLARIGLGLGLATGAVFGLAQQARGAHFLSHDVWSAFIVWFIAASIYAFGFGARLAAPGLKRDDDDREPSSLEMRAGAELDRAAQPGADRRCRGVCEPPHQRGLERLT